MPASPVPVPAPAPAFSYTVATDTDVARGVDPLRPTATAPPGDRVSDHLLPRVERSLGHAPTQPWVDVQSLAAHTADELVLAPGRDRACSYKTTDREPRHRIGHDASRHQTSRVGIEIRPRRDAMTVLARLPLGPFTPLAIRVADMVAVRHRSQRCQLGPFALHVPARVLRMPAVVVRVDPIIVTSELHHDVHMIVPVPAEPVPDRHSSGALAIRVEHVQPSEVIRDDVRPLPVRQDPVLGTKRQRAMPDPIQTILTIGIPFQAAPVRRAGTTLGKETTIPSIEQIARLTERPLRRSSDAERIDHVAARRDQVLVPMLVMTPPTEQITQQSCGIRTSRDFRNHEAHHRTVRPCRRRGTRP